MKVPASRLRLLEHACYYLHGTDHDALFEAAEELLRAGDVDAIRLRVDVSELSHIQEQSRNQGLFGSSICYAMVRNAESATPKQTDYLLDLIRTTEPQNRLIVCAPGMDWKKAAHKKLSALEQVGSCEFSVPDEAHFGKWFAHALQEVGVHLSEDALQLAVEQLTGLRTAARKFIQRLQWYDNGAAECIDRQVVAALLGEHVPDELEDWCHAVALRQPASISYCRRLIRSQQVAEVKMLAWLGTRLQQLLMYHWFQSRGVSNPMQSARVFGEARKKIHQEVAVWKPSELIQAQHHLTEAEKLLKGASVEDKPIVMEQLMRLLVRGEQG